MATAWFLREHAHVTVYEASDRVGGKIASSSLAGLPVELGPDTFLARAPWAVDLCRKLGLGDDLVAPATTKAYVWTRGALRALPEGTVLGVPYRLLPLARSGVVSPWGVVRAAADVALPRRPGDGSGDRSVRAVVGRRFGPEVVARLVEPLLGGIHAGRADRLSLASVAPSVAEAAVTHRSLLVGLRKAAAPAPGGAGPVFLGLRGGLERLVDRLAADLEVRVSTPVPSLGDLEADQVVLTIPAFAAARLVDGDVARELEAIDYASVVTVSLTYPPSALTRPLDGSGFLVPRVDGRLITACTWTSSKWGMPADPVLVRASAGRIGDERALAMSDADLVDQVHAELVEAMGLRAAAPTASRVTRWPRSFPQYDVGHEDRVTRIERLLPPGVHVAGAAYRGVGIASCIRQAERTAQRIIRSGS